MPPLEQLRSGRDDSSIHECELQQATGQAPLQTSY
jgi:hypothetical protein